MRITVHLDTFDRIDPCAYAVLWLEKESRKWSREGHAGLSLPEWGIWKATPAGTSICSPRDAQPLCVLEGLGLGEHTGPFEGEAGRAQWCGAEDPQSTTGHWHVQCIDEDLAQPECSVFAGDGAA
jgi:hypothetical protein